MKKSRRHPDLFDAREALLYLHQPPENIATLETLRAKGLLRGVKIGKELTYFRDELDAAVDRLRTGATDSSDVSDSGHMKLKSEPPHHPSRLRVRTNEMSSRGPKLRLGGEGR